MTIWLTRPHAQSTRMATALKRPTIIAPVQHIETRNVVIEGAYDALITTSQHACAGVKQFHDLPLYTVGETSAQAARDAGFSLALALAQDAGGLAAMLVSAHTAPMRFLYLAGAETRVDIAALLKERGHHVTTIITYEAVKEPVLPEAFQATWQAITGAVFMSVGAVKAAQALLQQHGLDTSHCGAIHAFCISPTVAEAAKATTWAGIHISRQPTQQSLIEAIETAISA